MMRRLMKLHKDSQGFTLIELMIVVAIIGILAAIAIPNFLKYQMKSKQAEAKTNIGAIKTSETAYFAENDTYIVCAPHPGAAGSATTQKSAWGAGNAGFVAIGFQPAGDVYFNYAVAISAAAAPLPAGANMAISTEGDLDGDAAFQYFTLNTNGALAGTLGAYAPATAYEIFTSGDDF